MSIYFHLFSKYIDLESKKYNYKVLINDTWTIT